MSKSFDQGNQTTRRNAGVLLNLDTILCSGLKCEVETRRSPTIVRHTQLNYPSRGTQEGSRAPLLDT